MSQISPELSVRPYSNRQPLLFGDFTLDERAHEMVRVEALLRREQEWFCEDDALLVDTKPDIIGAIATGNLVPVLFDETSLRPTNDFSQRLTTEELWSLSDSEGASEFSVPYLRPSALKILKAVTSEAQTTFLMEDDLPNGVRSFRYSVTSMTRTRNYQRGLVDKGTLAFDSNDNGSNSTHQYGMAFDIDHSGVYILQGNVWRGVGIGREEELFPEQAVDILADILENFQKAGVINSICEVPNGRGCFHVAVNPDIPF